MQTELENIIRTTVGEPDPLKMWSAQSVSSFYDSRVGPLSDALVSYAEKKIKEISTHQINLYKIGKIKIKDSDELIKILKGDFQPVYSSVMGRFNSRAANSGEVFAFQTRMNDIFTRVYTQAAADFNELCNKTSMIQTTNNTFHTFQGVYGNVENSNLTQNFTTYTVTCGDWDSLATALQAQGIAKTDIYELQNIVKQEEAISSEGKRLGAGACGWIREMVSKTIDGTWNFSTALAAGVLTNYLSQYLGI